MASRVNVLTPPRAQPKWAVSATAQDACFSSATPQSLDNEKDESKLKGYVPTFMSKESCVVSAGLDDDV